MTSATNVRVAVRVRPLNKREIDNSSQSIVEMCGNKTIISMHKGTTVTGDENRSVGKEFMFDHSYWSADSRDSHFVSQEQVYTDLGEEVLKSAFNGYNACVFAYGQTGSGKSYTMMGVPGAAGLIPRICETLFERIGNENSQSNSYKTEVSYMEIYNERVRDLLRPASSKQLHNLRVREHPSEGPYVENLTKHLVSDYSALIELMDLGNTHRVTAATEMNDVSSRSHAIFTITFTQAKFDSNLPSETISKINLVDLAGSERVSATGATGDRLKEGGNINRSLVCLGNVISALAKMTTHRGTRDKKAFVPYRDSVLTWLLKESLGGNAKTIMLAAISPADINYGETMSTLQYANRAKNIMNRPTVNEDSNVKLIRELRAEIDRLKMMIGQQTGKEAALTDSYASENLHRKQEQVAELTRSWTGKWFELHKIAKEHELALRSEGIKMTVGSELPHFIAMDNDILSTGVVIYHLQMGETTLGLTSCDIDLAGPGIVEQHCLVTHVDGKVLLHPQHGSCYVNYDEITVPTKLNQGDFIQLGDAITFRFNHPKEAMELKQGEGQAIGPQAVSLFTSPHQTKQLLKKQEEILEANRKSFELQKLKIEEDFVAKARLVQDELEREREKARSEKERYEMEMEKLTLERKRLERLQQEMMEREEERNSTPVSRDPADLDSFLDDNDDSSKNGGSRVEEPQLMTLESVTGGDSISTHTTDVLSPPGGTESVGPSPVLLADDTASSTTMKIDNIVGPLLWGGDMSHADMVAASGKLMVDIFASSNPEEREDNYQQLVSRVQFAAVGKESSQKELEQLKQLEGVLSNMKAELLMNQNSKEEFKSLKQENQLIMKEKSELEEKVTTLEEQLSSKAKKEHSKQKSSGSGLRRRSTNLETFSVHIPRYFSRGSGNHLHYVFEVKLRLDREKWFVYRRYEQFQELHKQMKLVYPELEALAFPGAPPKWFKWLRGGGDELLTKRQKDLELYLQSFFKLCTSIPHCPLSDESSARKPLNRETLGEFHTFFVPSIMEITSPREQCTNATV